MYKVTIEVTLTDEDLLAGQYELTLRPADTITEKMPPDEYRDWMLGRDIAAGLARRRDRYNWCRLHMWDVPKKNGKRIGDIPDPRKGRRQCNNQQNPTDTCWYDERKDPRWDHCLFCGQPHTRK